jgi:hypothetical protein
MRTCVLLKVLQTAIALFALSAASAAPVDNQTPLHTDNAALLERGKYMIVTGHCNNCHTDGYAANAGEIPEAKWLLGNSVGWRGKAGTVYAPNLRLYVQSMSLEAWLVAARNSRPRAPMPWWSLRETSSEDLIAMYSYIASLRPIGLPAPSFLPPDRTPPPPYNQLPDLSFAR